MKRAIFEFGNEEGLAKFIAELIRNGIVFESVESGNQYIVTFSGGY